ncbi:MAG: MoxR family ATPase [Candidatus Nanopelagicales bacterium]
MSLEFVEFTGTESYLTDPALEAAVRCALTLEKPLLVRGEPGTGKTLLAEAIAEATGLELITWHVKSTTRAQDGLYHYDTVQRLYDSRFGDHDVRDIREYIHMGPVGKAFQSEERVVLLIDEIDKADIEFPNDLLHELDKMRFVVSETGDEVAAKNRPIVVITSNAEKELPDAFLRRCVFHFIDFPDAELMRQIVEVHHPGVNDQLLSQALDTFYQVRELDNLRKPPSTSELVDWVTMLIAASPGSQLDKELALGSELPYLGTLLKKEQDLDSLRNRGSRFQRPRY